MDGKEYKELENITWLVTRLRGRFSEDRYRQIARFQNHPHSPKHDISLIFNEELNNISQEFENLSAIDVAISNTTAARTYFGQEKVSKIAMLASIVVRLRKEHLDTSGEVMSSEEPDLETSRKERNEIY